MILRPFPEVMINHQMILRPFPEVYAVFSTGYTFGAPTPPPGSPYSPVPVTQLELLTKGFNSNIIIQQPEYPVSPKKPTFTENKQSHQKCEEKCCSIKAPQKPCMCSNSPSSTTSAAKTKFVETTSGCSRTNPVDWSSVSVKKEPGTPCQVAEITTSVSPVVKIEVTSPTTPKNVLHDIHSGNIPVGIAVARQRIQQHEIVSSPSLPPTGLLTTVNTSTHIKEMSRISEIDSTPGMAANTTGGVPTNGSTLMQCTDDRSTGLAGWPVGGTHSSALTAPTLWQYPGSSISMWTKNLSSYGLPTFCSHFIR
ncbi:hypothetical protein QE152_g26957 [Popillia japonica]|uniref:Uncharacterized protein n=1 Tax=Popillia japonica TaxID=7064 RepID=A0AAW1JWF7_POPJA